ncbi:MAG: methyltransferase domain-containing protein [Burkholderiales bacterium]
MAHPQQAEFVSTVRGYYPHIFSGARVLEVGSLDINGSVREMFLNCNYTGADLQIGPGVDLACQGQVLEFPSSTFDTTISAECMEHNPYWRETLGNMLRMTKPDGMVLITCATRGRLEHGTSRTNPDASPFTSAARWDYYRNLTARDIESALNLSGWLSDWRFWVNHISKDLYFVGIRQGNGLKLNEEMCRQMNALYAMTSSAKAFRRGLKTKLFGDLWSRP